MVTLNLSIDLIEDISDLTSSKYVRFWTRSLSEFFGWSEHATCEWAERLRRQITHPDTYRHAHPAHFVPHLLLPQEALVSGPFKAAPICSDVERAIAGSCNWASDNFDHRAAKKRVELLLSQYGMNMPEVDEQSGHTLFEWRRRLAERMTRDYPVFWRPFLSTVLGWHVESVTEWSQQYMMWLTSGESGCYRRGPAHQVVDLVIPDSLRWNLDINWFSLWREVFEAIDHEGASRSTDYDPHGAKRRLVHVLEKYDSTVAIRLEVPSDDQQEAMINTPYYLRFWARMLDEILGWSHSKVLQWAERYRGELTGVSESAPSAFFHCGALRAILSLLTEPLLLQFGIATYLHAERKIENAILDLCQEGGAPEYDPGYNFKEAGEHYRRIVRELGG